MKRRNRVRDWKEHFRFTCVTANDGVVGFDFNRLRYIGVPATREIKEGKGTFAARDPLVSQLFDVFCKAEDTAGATLNSIFVAARTHLRYVDESGHKPFTREGVESYLQLMSNRQRLGEIKDSTESVRRASLIALLKRLDLPYRAWVEGVPTPSKTQLEPTPGYSDEDLKQLLPLLRSLFKQLYKQLTDDPERHLNAWKPVMTMVFRWKGVSYSVCSALTKLFCAGAYLMSYYTCVNTSVLLQLQRPSAGEGSLPGRWREMPAFKRRAFKSLTVTLGENNLIEVPSYAIELLEHLIDASSLADPLPGAQLLLSCNHRVARPMRASTLSAFNGWLRYRFPMYDVQGQKLLPLVKRFRATGARLALARKGPMAAAMLLGNTPDVVKSSYSTGNPHENNLTLRDSFNVLERQVRDGTGTAAAKEAEKQDQGVEILAWAKYLARSAPPISNANGSFCNATSNSDKSKFFTAKARKRELISAQQSIACADLGNCFSCPDQVIVESVDDIWNILSFRDHLDDSRYTHVDAKHHQKKLRVSAQRH